MSTSRPSRSEYAPLPASDDVDNVAQSSSPTAPRTASRRLRRNHKPSSSPIALELDTLFRRWTATISQKMQLKRGSKRRRGKHNLIDDRDRSKPVEILASVFEPVGRDGSKDIASDDKGKQSLVMTLDHEPPMTRQEFDELVHAVRQAIDGGIHPRLNSKGSSGSYFARNKLGHTVAIFKPKDEEPYGRLNPKFTKYVHRIFLSRIIPFGRACLIPNLSYLSESAASLLDRRLETHIVPRTEVVSLSSPAFYYDWIDRERARGRGGRKGKLREKDGSFQAFLKGFTDASVFLRDHTIPGRPLSQTLDTSAHRKGRVNLFGPLKCLCGRAEAEPDELYDDDEDGAGDARFRWTEESMTSFRRELEKLVILDYIIRNTDRGLDNFMIKACTCSTPRGSATPVLTTEPPTAQPPMTEVFSKPMSSTIKSSTSDSRFAPSETHVHVAAIDNSLAFPHAHPTGWRTFTYGWLHLPLSLIGRPFSNETRQHFLTKLTDSTWWSDTTLELRTLFGQDPDFKERMFYKQMAVMKGQAYNVVQTLLDNEGPVELCRKPKRLVWDDLIEVADDEITRALINDAGRGRASPVPVASQAESSSSPRVLNPCSIVVPQQGSSSTFEPASAPPLAGMSSSASIMYSPPTIAPMTTSQQPVMTQVPRRPGHTKSLSVSSILSATGLPKSSPGLSIMTTPRSDLSSQHDDDDYDENDQVDASRLSESLTGVEMVKHMDWVEFGEGRDKMTREERRREREADQVRMGRTRIQNEASRIEARSRSRRESRRDVGEDDEDDMPELNEGGQAGLEGSDEDERDDQVGDLSWGVMSENDLDKQTHSNVHRLFSTSDVDGVGNRERVAAEGIGRPVLRARSGSLTQLPSSSLTFQEHEGIGRKSEDVATRSSRPSLLARGARSRYSVDSSRQTRFDNVEATLNATVPQKVVVVERLETLKDEPRPNVLQWLCGEVEQA
ncbi:hypothetical protein ACM66B_006084 [Microbotryomycetes sp. NB124-2]